MTLAEKAHRARTLAASFQRIINLHRIEFSPAVPPAVPPPALPDRTAIYRHYQRQVLAGVSVFNRRGRREAKQRASAWAEGEAQRQLAEAKQRHAQWQAHYDSRWRQLCDNAPDVVIETLGEAFEDNEVPSAAVGVDNDEAALVVLVPDVTMVVPDQMPTTTQAGNLSLRKITQRDREDYYKLYVCGQLLVTLREAFAVAPGLRSARVAVLRNDGTDAYGKLKISCLLAARFQRAALDKVHWATADAAQVVNDVATDLVINQRGRSKGLSPINLGIEPELAELIAAIDARELAEGDEGQEATAPTDHVAPTAVRASAAAPVAVGAEALQNQSGKRGSTGLSGWLNKPIAKALLIVFAVPVAICAIIGAVGAVAAVVGGDGNEVPALVTTPAVTEPASLTTVQPRSLSDAATSAPPSATPAQSESDNAPEPAPPPPPPPNEGDNDPPEPPPAPPAATQQGVHPGAFCEPEWAFGYTSAGTLMQCKPSATDSRFRWRSAE